MSCSVLVDYGRYRTPCVVRRAGLRFETGVLILISVDSQDSDVFYYRLYSVLFFFFFFSSRRRHTRSDRDWSSDVCSSDLGVAMVLAAALGLALAVATQTAGRVVRGLVDAYVELFRNTPLLIQIFIVYFEIGRASCRERV